MLRTILRLAVLLGAAVTAHAAGKAMVWSGTLGRSPIVVQITGTPPPGGEGDWIGSYFYASHRFDIQLQGRLDTHGHWQLMERVGHPGGGTGITARWDMPVPLASTWRGEWIDSNGRHLPIVLSRVSPAALPDAQEPTLTALKSEFDPYAYLRLSTIRLHKDKRDTFNGHDLQWWSHAASGIHLFEVASGYPDAARARINRTLQSRLWHWIGDYYECVSGTGPDDADYAATTTVRQVDAHVVSASLFSSFYCGGAHPDFGDSPVNIDVRTGRELDLEDVLWVGQDRAIHAAPGDGWNKAWAAYRDKTFAPWVIRTLKALHPHDMAPATANADGAECDYTDPQLWDFPAWYVTPRGIHVAAYFPRVARACDNPDWAILPWRAVDAHRGAVPLH